MPSVHNVIRTECMHPGKGSPLLQWNPSLVFAALALLLKVRQTAFELPARVSETKRYLVEGMLRLVLRKLNEACHRYYRRSRGPRRWR